MSRKGVIGLGMSLSVYGIYQLSDIGDARQTAVVDKMTAVRKIISI